jgi:phosphate transport system permease protein
MSAVSSLQRPDDRLRRRRIVNRGMESLAWLAAAVAVAILGLVVWTVARKGGSELNLDFFTKTQVPFAPPNVKQGLANAFAGTLVVVGLATAMAVPVYGLIVVAHGQSALAGAFALAVLMLPLVARATIEVLALVPNSLREAALGVGAPRWRATLGIVLPQTVGGVLTGATLAVARVAGETAPLLFVNSLVGNPVDWNPAHALQTVPVAIFELSESPDPADHARAWAGALVLLLFILFASLTARWLATRSRRKLGRAAR